MGTSDLDRIHSDGGFERRVIDIHVHPRYVPGQAHYDVGIAEAIDIFVFSDFVRPVCLPYLPVDDDNFLEGNYVTLVGWGYSIQARNNVQFVASSNLKLRSFQVNDNSQCLFQDCLMIINFVVINHRENSTNTSICAMF